MPRENKTKYALLGMLAWQPMSGYDIKRVIEGSLSYFWQESYGQIYPIMKQLAREGLAVMTVEAREGKPTRKLYAITEAGRETLAAWLARPAEAPNHRMEILLKVLYANHMSDDTLREHITRFRGECAGMLATLQGVETEVRAKYAHMPHGPGGLMTLRCGVRYSQAMVDWCDEVEAMLDAMEQGKGGNDDRAQ